MGSHGGMERFVQGEFQRIENRSSLTEALSVEVRVEVVQADAGQLVIPYPVDFSEDSSIERSVEHQHHVVMSDHRGRQRPVIGYNRLVVNSITHFRH